MKNKMLRIGALSSTLLVILAVGGMIGCAAKRVVLVPAPNAMIATEPNSAEASSNGVQVVVRADAWNGRPHDLDTKITPLRVTIQNHSGNPLAIRYKDFVLLSSLNDQHYAAIPPFDIRGTEYVSQLKTGPQSLPAAYVEQQAKPRPVLVSASASQDPPRPDPLPRRTRVVITPEFGWDHFYVAPWWGYAYPGIGFWGSPWAPDWGYYNLYYPYWQVNLPTRSMLRKAVPEGVVADGGSVTGFLYFQKPKAGKSQQITFEATLVNAKTDKKFGQVSVPFVEEGKK